MWAERRHSPALTSALLEEQLHILLVLLLLQGQLAVHLQALPLQRHLQPVHQPLLLLQLHLQLREGDLLLVLLLSQCHHLSQDQPGSARLSHDTIVFPQVILSQLVNVVPRKSPGLSCLSHSAVDSELLPTLRAGSPGGTYHKPFPTTEY